MCSLKVISVLFKHVFLVVDFSTDLTTQTQDPEGHAGVKSL